MGFWEGFSNKVNKDMFGGTGASPSSFNAKKGGSEKGLMDKVGALSASHIGLNAQGKQWWDKGLGSKAQLLDNGLQPGYNQLLPSDNYNRYMSKGYKDVSNVSHIGSLMQLIGRSPAPRKTIVKVPLSFINKYLGEL